MKQRLELPLCSIYHLYGLAFYFMVLSRRMSRHSDRFPHVCLHSAQLLLLTNLFFLLDLYTAWLTRDYCWIR